MQRLRNKSRPLAAQVLALLLAVWLNLWLTPCVMAMDDGMSGAMSGRMMDSGAHCGHCPEPESPCDSDEGSSCALVDQVSQHGSALIPHSDNSSFETALPALEPRWLPTPRDRHTVFLPDIRPAGRSVPIYLVHCAFLK
jgi:hypothetical protein